MTIQETLPQEIEELISLYNTNMKLNSFLYENKDCNALIKKVSGVDRWQFINRQEAIAIRLIDFAHSLHNKKVEIAKGKFNPATTGVIKHPKRKEYKGKDYPHTVSFRREHEDRTYPAPETIALWVDTDDKVTSHLYTINNLTIIE